MDALFGARRYVLACVFVSVVGGLLAAQIALTTPYNVHPDEFIHVDAFCYFEARAWLPPLNLEGLNYGPEGESRVYDSEIVYWVYGRASAGLEWLRGLLAPAGSPVVSLGAELSWQQFLPVMLQPTLIVGPRITRCLPHFARFRLFNVGLLLVTVGILFAVGLRQAWAAGIGMVMLCLPQVIYTYGYANSDAWALSFAIFLIVFALAERRPLGSLGKAALLGLLTGIVLVSKQSVWPAIPFAYALIGYRLWQDWRSGQVERRPAVWRQAAVALATAILVIAPMRIWYPLSQGGDVPAQLAQIREERAVPGFKPSNPYAAGRQLRSKGVGLDQIVFNWHWVTSTAQSFYGSFGYQPYAAPIAADWLALALATLNIALTAAIARRHWQDLPDTLRLALAGGPLLAGVCVAASMFNSWTHDFQPQGRYVFVAVAPIALWMWGTLPWEGPRLRAVRLASAAVLLVLCAYVLRHDIFVNPAFQM